ncbi:MAG: tetratricopeptide repeat protein [Spirochaetota bacterium]|nr:tetratricopeptide repeat protein [Spirochaetota bacterium]
MISIYYYLFLIIIPIGFLVFFVFGSAQLTARLRNAEEYINNNDYQKASEIVKKIIEKKNDHVPARYLRVQIYIDQKQYLLAIAELNSIQSITDYKKFVSEQEIHSQLAMLYNKTGQWQREVQEYIALLTLNPDDILANNRVGQALYNQGQFESALAYLTKALELDPSQMDCYLPLGISLYHLSQYDEAEQFLSKVIEFLKDQHEAYYYLGLIKRDMKDFDAAIEMFENSKSDNKFFINSLYNLGEIYLHQSKYREAIATLELGVDKLKKKAEESLDYRYLLAECYEKNNEIEDAVFQWQEIARDKPGYRDIQSKIEGYKEILNNETMKLLFTTPMSGLQPLIIELIARLNYNITSTQTVNENENLYRAFNIKRMNDPSTIIYFNRTTREISIDQVDAFYKMAVNEKCNNCIYITTSGFSQKVKNAMASRNVELIDSNELSRIIGKIRLNRPVL